MCCIAFESPFGNSNLPIFVFALIVFVLLIPLQNQQECFSIQMSKFTPTLLRLLGQRLKAVRLSAAQFPDGLGRASSGNHAVGNAFRSEGRAIIGDAIWKSSEGAPRGRGTPSTHKKRRKSTDVPPLIRTFFEPVWGRTGAGNDCHRPVWRWTRTSHPYRLYCGALKNPVNRRYTREKAPAHACRSLAWKTDQSVASDPFGISL